MAHHIPPLYDKEFSCPICELTFTTKKIRSRFIRVEKMDADFFKSYKEDSYIPYYYEVNVCPQCGYSFTDAFSPSFPPDTKEMIVSKISKQWHPRDFGGERTWDDAVQTYKLALYSATLKKEQSLVIGGLTLRIAWLYRMKEDEENEQRFLAYTLKHYKDAFIRSEHVGTQMSDMRLCYLIAEMARRLGRWDEAVQFYSQVIKHERRHEEKQLVDMAREQWLQMRDAQKASPSEQ